MPTAWTGDRGRSSSSVDGVVVRRVAQAPDYPMQLMIGVFDFPAKAVAGEPVPVPELVVERGHRDAARRPGGAGLTVSRRRGPCP